MSILIVILIISFLIIIHELGHFIAARKVGVKVKEFGLGYPPRLATIFSWDKTDFTLNLIPFGGFVRLEGEAGPEDISQPEVEELIQSQKDDPKAEAPFYAKPPNLKMKVILAGTLVNLIFAVVAFSVVFSLMGIPVPLLDQARIGQVASDSPAEQAGVPVNANITSVRVDNAIYQIESFTEMQAVVADYRGETLTLTITEQCDNLKCPDQVNEYQVYARTADETPEGEGSLGVVFDDVIFNFYPWYEMPFRGSWYGLKQAAALAYLILAALADMMKQLVTSGTVSREVAGPVGIVHETQKGNIISDNHLHNLSFAGMLSLNLAVVNLLPIPALDGGRALFIFLEKFFGQKKINKIEQYANYGGFVLLVLLIITITISDINRIING